MTNGERIYGFEIVFNDECPLQCFSSKSAGVSLHLFNTRHNLLTLMVSVKEPARNRSYLLKGIRPGDKLRFRYLQTTKRKSQTIRALKGLGRKTIIYNLKPGYRLGLDVFLKDGGKWRTSHPDKGGFSFILGNVPNTHARAFLMAGNEKEYWHWQLDDLYPGDGIKLRVVQTNWCDEPPKVKWLS
jgi:hypothetical protein